MPSLDTFSLFLNQPKELQMMVWRAAIRQGDRFVLMFQDSCRIMPTPRGLYSPLLATCRQSRQVFLEAYPVQIPVFDQARWPPEARAPPWLSRGTYEPLGSEASSMTVVTTRGGGGER